MPPRRHSLRLWLALLSAGCGLGGNPAKADEPARLPAFQNEIQPLLDRYCYDCHGGGIKKGNLTLDEFTTEATLAQPALWWHVLKKTRSGLMPPADEARPSPAEVTRLGEWIKTQIFRLDPAHPDPGRVTLRRLNQIEYRNTIRDLTGVAYDTALNFPPDDTGEGFDNLGEVLNISPMLLEKYFDAAQAIVDEAVASHGLRPFAAPDQTGPFPSDPAARPAYARTLLDHFATRAFRRPVSQTTLDGLLHLAQTSSVQPDRLDTTGLAQALVAILASPRFIFREENTQPAAPGEPYPLVDEFALASRLSYFFWSSCPDEELLRLARENRLRASLDQQVTRLRQDPRSSQLIENFVGQWLHSRDIKNVAINDFDIFLRENHHPEIDQARQTLRDLQSIPDARRTPEEKKRGADATKIVTKAFASGRPKLTTDLREAMRRETEMHFAYILAEQRSALELLDCDYAFLNEKLAKHYGIPGVTGKEMRRVILPADSPRGGVLTQGTVLAATSNPTRTSPVKRGVFILDNILGAPPSPPPPNIPALEDAASPEALARMTLRETLELHRAQPLCSSCHNAMDPLGLALENFNAMGQWREHEKNQPINPAGRLISGRDFANIRELKRLLVTAHAQDFYYCLSEKLLIYATGRSLDYRDTATLDQLVARLTADGGRLDSLLDGVIRSAPFQRQRPAPSTAATLTAQRSPSTPPTP